MAKEKYMEEFDDFMNKYISGTTSGEEAGALIARLAQYYCEKNMGLATRDVSYNKKYSELADSIDEITGKPISMAKAEIMTKATDEYGRYLEAKIHIQNLEQCINSLKSLQKGILNEFSHVGNI